MEDVLRSQTLTNLYKEHGLEPIKSLGSGCYSTVILAKYLKIAEKHPLIAKKHPLIAVKNIDMRQSGDYVKRFLPRELEIVKAIRHQNICTVFEVIEQRPFVCFLTELCEGKDLLAKINDTRRIAEPDAKILFRQLIEALSYLASLEIVHRDLKCENIFLDKHQNIKLGDFGFARYLKTGEKSSTFCGSRAYVAPEILRSVEYSGHTADIWSAGIVLYVMLSGVMPYDERNVPRMIENQLKHKIQFTRSAALSIEAKTLIYELLHPHPASRPTYQQIKLSEWLKATPHTMLGPNEEQSPTTDAAAKDTPKKEPSSQSQKESNKN